MAGGLRALGALKQRTAPHTPPAGQPQPSPVIYLMISFSQASAMSAWGWNSQWRKWHYWDFNLTCWRVGSEGVSPLFQTTALLGHREACPCLCCWPWRIILIVFHYLWISENEKMLASEMKSPHLWFLSDHSCGSLHPFQPVPHVDVSRYCFHQNEVILQLLVFSLNSFLEKFQTYNKLKN